MLLGKSKSTVSRGDIKIQTIDKEAARRDHINEEEC
jgi:hypothetical protein